MKSTRGSRSSMVGAGAWDPKAGTRNGACHSIQECNSPLIFGMFLSCVMDMDVLLPLF